MREYGDEIKFMSWSWNFG